MLLNKNRFHHFHLEIISDNFFPKRIENSPKGTNMLRSQAKLPFQGSLAAALSLPCACAIASASAGGNDASDRCQTSGVYEKKPVEDR